MNEAGARVVNYIAKHPHRHRESKQIDSRQTQDAKMAKKKTKRIEDGFWGNCAIAVMSGVQDDDIDKLQVEDASLIPIHFQGIDPSVQTPTCLRGWNQEDAAHRCKKAAATLASNVSKAIDDMCQSGQGDLQSNMTAAMAAGSAVAFPPLDGDDGDDDVLSGSEPYHFLVQHIDKYCYCVLQGLDLLQCASIVLPTNARASSDEAASAWGGGGSTRTTAAACRAPGRAAPATLRPRAPPPTH